MQGGNALGGPEKMRKSAQKMWKMQQKKCAKNALSAVKLDFGLMRFFGLPVMGKKNIFGQNLKVNLIILSILDAIF